MCRLCGTYDEERETVYSRSSPAYFILYKIYFTIIYTQTGECASELSDVSKIISECAYTCKYRKPNAYSSKVKCIINVLKCLILRAEIDG